MQLIKIAVVENEDIFLDELRRYLEKWRTEKEEREIEITVYRSGEEVLEAALDANILFMDIQLDGKLNGVETAKLLREKRYNQKLVFMTSFSEYALEGYKVEAMDYLLKPVSYEDIRLCMEKLVKYLSSGYYLCRMKEATIRIPYNKIKYCFSALHNVEFFTDDGIYHQAGSLEKLKSVLPPQFIRCHRTAIINLNHVIGIKGNQVFMSDGETVPVSGTYIAKVRDAYLDQMV